MISAPDCYKRTMNVKSSRKNPRAPGPKKTRVEFAITFLFEIRCDKFPSFDMVSKTGEFQDSMLF